MHRLLATNLTAPLAETAAEQSSQQWLAGLLIALGIAIMVILLSVSARSKMARRGADQSTPRERIEQIKAAGNRHQSQAAPMARHLDEIAERAAMLDNKAERLEQLLAEADERIAMLRALNQPPPEAENSTAAPAREPAHQTMREPAAPPRLDPLARSVYELADSGRTPLEIARELDEQVGKVDLILALRGR